MNPPPQGRVYCDEKQKRRDDLMRLNMDVDLVGAGNELTPISWEVICASVQHGAFLVVIEGLVYDVREWIEVRPSAPGV